MRGSARLCRIRIRSFRSVCAPSQRQQPRDDAYKATVPISGLLPMARSPSVISALSSTPVGVLRGREGSDRFFGDQHAGGHGASSLSRTLCRRLAGVKGFSSKPCPWGSNLLRSAACPV